MRQVEFNKLMGQLPKLTPVQRQKLVVALLEKSAVDEAVNTVNSRVANHPRCPHCDCDNLRKWGQRGGIQRFRCQGCTKTFNGLTGTPLARLRHREAWTKFAQAMKDSLSVRESAAASGVHSTTTFRWRHRWLSVPRDCKDKVFTDIVEADETFFLESQKGSRVWKKAKRGDIDMPSRLPRKRGGTASKPGLSTEQIPVLVVCDRHGATTDAVLPSVTKEAIKAVLLPIISKEALLCTDGLPIYRTIANEEGFAHQAVNVSAGIRVKQGVFHIQHVNGYHSRLKGWLRSFKGVATCYLANYLGWRRLLEQHGDRLKPVEILKLAMG